MDNEFTTARIIKKLDGFLERFSSLSEEFETSEMTAREVIDQLTDIRVEINKELTSIERAPRTWAEKDIYIPALDEASCHLDKVKEVDSFTEAFELSYEAEFSLGHYRSQIEKT